MCAKALKGGSALLLSFCTLNRLAHYPKFSACLSYSRSPFFKGKVCNSNVERARARRSGSVWRLNLSSVANADGDTSSSCTVETDPIKDSANALDIRVGLILRAWRHPEADSLYVEEVDVGEPEPRTICSGLVNYVPLDHLQDRKVVVLANLKPRNMRGIKSCGMLMAASDASHENVELLVPPEDSIPGERIWFGTEDEREKQPVAATPNQIQKKKIWELVQPHLKTDASCVAALGVHPMRTSSGVVVCKSMKNGNIS